MPKFLNTNNSISSSEFSSTYSNDIIIISKDVIFQVHDKTFKEILKSSYEMTDFLKTFIGLEVNSENLKIYNSSFITNNYKRRESDILYKDIIQNTFYLIEHQSTVNIDMPRRILEYSTELMREIKKNKIEFARFLYLLSRLEPKEEGTQKEQYRRFAEKMYRWIQSEKDCRQLKTALNLYAYMHRERGENYADK